MGYLVIGLGTKKPRDGAVMELGSVTYREERPDDVFGNALLIPCEFMGDDENQETSREARPA